MESVRLWQMINNHITSVGEEILCIKKHRGIDVCSVMLNGRVLICVGAPQLGHRVHVHPLPERDEDTRNSAGETKQTVVEQICSTRAKGECLCIPLSDLSIKTGAPAHKQ